MSAKEDYQVFVYGMANKFLGTSDYENYRLLRIAAEKEADAELATLVMAARGVSDNLTKTEIVDIDGKQYNVWSIVGDAEKDELAAVLK